MDETITYEPEEDELTLYHILTMVDSILEELRWLKVIIEQEIEKEGANGDKATLP